MQRGATTMAMRERLEAALGLAVSSARFAGCELVSRQAQGGWWRDELSFLSASGETVPGLFLHPGEEARPVPAVLYCHAHGNRYEHGMEELELGRPALAGPYGSSLAQLGIASLCLEMPCFGTRQVPGEQARAKAHLWAGSTLFGQMLHELAAGVSFLADQPQIDGGRIAVLGFSMGSTHAFWLAALDERLAAGVALCSFADLATLIAQGAHDGHGIYMMVPGLTAVLSTGELAGLAAPRALFIGAGLADWSTPPQALQVARKALEEAYAAQGAGHRLQFYVEPQGGHQETPAMRAAALGFLADQLGIKAALRAAS
jgi:dienelactone hydrolase